MAFGGVVILHVSFRLKRERTVVEMKTPFFGNVAESPSQQPRKASAYINT